MSSASETSRREAHPPKADLCSRPSGAGYALERLPGVDGITLFGPPDPLRRGGVISFAIEGLHPHDIAEVCDRHGVCVRAGHHCAQPLMRRLGVPASSRASFAIHSAREDVDRLVDGLHHVRKVFRLD